MISGKYTADFYRKAVHPIKVDYNVLGSFPQF